MDVASKSTVLGAFDGRVFEYEGERWRFEKRAEQYVVRWWPPGAAQAEAQTFEVAHTFGLDPLQQYLLRGEAGKLQSLTVAWDVAGQRWIHLQPGQRIQPDDALHWTGAYQTWNGMCADCHSTRLDRGYDADTGAHATTWAEIDVACEACHGPGAAHVERVEARSKGRKVMPVHGDGLVVDFAGGTAQQQVDACGRCHARRRSTSPLYVHGESLFDHYVPTTLDEGLYHADGQILDEVYVYGSFTQSRMYVAGVRCSDCHDPHSAGLRLEGDALCMQCHGGGEAKRFRGMPTGGYDEPAHHHHAPGEPGSACVDCHMPATTYMEIDPRRDHRMGIPRPDQSVLLGTPNACTGCHADQTDGWAAEKAGAWWGAGHERPFDFAGLVFDARRGDSATVAGLGEWVDRTHDSPAVRATAVELAGRFGREGAQVVDRALRDPHPWIRTTAAAATQAWPLEARSARVTPLLEDPVRSVRIEAARSLAPLEAAGGLAPTSRAPFDRALGELVNSLESAADHPGNRLNLAVLAQQRGDPGTARSQYRRALALDARFLPARLNLVQLLDAAGEPAEAERVVREGLRLDPSSGDLHYALGLLLAQGGADGTSSRLPEAARELEEAARLLPDHPRAHYNLGLARQRLGDVARARTALERAEALAPSDPEVLQALAIFHSQQGDWAAVRRYAQAMLQVAPGDPSARAMLMRAERELAAQGGR